MFRFLPLLLNVSFNDTFCHFSANGADIISLTPKLTTPQLSFHFRMKTKNFFCRQTFQNLDNSCRRISRRSAQKQMNMIPVCSKRFKFKTMSVTDLQKNSFDSLFQRRFKQQIFSVFDNPNKMIPNIKTRMCSRLYFAHTDKNTFSQEFFEFSRRVMPFPAPLSNPPAKVTPPQVVGYNMN